MRPPKPIPEDRLAELAEYGRHKQKGKELLHFLCMWLRVYGGMQSTEIASALRLSVRTVRAVQAAFIRRGSEALRVSPQGGRRRQSMAPEEEKAFLDGFAVAAKDASLLVVSEIKAAFEERLGRSVHKTTVYRLLKRHGWRKVVPRPRHPKKEAEAAEAFKKGASRTGSPSLGQGRKVGS